MANVTIYTSSTCSACKMAKQFFQEKGVQYTEYDVESDETKAKEMTQKTGQTSVPVIIVDGKTIVGFDKAKISQALGL